MVAINEADEYRLLNVKGGTYITIPPDSPLLTGHEYINDPRQRWTFVPTANVNRYHIKSAQDNDRYLAVPAGNVENGTRLRAIAEPYEWRIIDEGNNAVAARIQMTDGGRNVDLHEGLQANGTSVQLWEWADHPWYNDQIWVLEKVRHE